MGYGQYLVSKVIHGQNLGALVVFVGIVMEKLAVIPCFADIPAAADAVCGVGFVRDNPPSAVKERQGMNRVLVHPEPVFQNNWDTHCWDRRPMI